MRSMSTTPAAEVAARRPPPPRTQDLAPSICRRPISRCSGSATIRRRPARGRPRASTAPSGTQQDRDRAEAVERRDGDERARAHVHQDADVLALAHAERDQPADDVVDPALGRRAACGRGPRRGRGRRRAAAPACSSSSSASEMRVSRPDLLQARPGAAAARRPRRRARARRRRCVTRLPQLRGRDRRRPRRRARARTRRRGTDPGARLGRSSASLTGHDLLRAARRRPRASAAQAATAGQVVPRRGRADDEPEVPGAQRHLVDLGARRGRRDRPHGCAAGRSRRPPRRRSGPGRSMSASVTRRSSMTKPPWSMRLWATNWRMKSASAGPGQATQPSPCRKRRWPRAAAAPRGRAAGRTKSTCWRSGLDRVQQPEARAARPGGQRPCAPRTSADEGRGRATAELLGEPERDRAARVDRAAEGDQAGDALARR